jgi:hypothetical protein
MALKERFESEKNRSFFFYSKLPCQTIFMKNAPNEQKHGALKNTIKNRFRNVKMFKIPF